MFKATTLHLLAWVQFFVKSHQIVKNGVHGSLLVIKANEKAGAPQSLGGRTEQLRLNGLVFKLAKRSIKVLACAKKNKFT